ncbi:hypothetical protein [Streptomyces sp. NPDC093060]|uniref:class I SAM-dependent methyltransferase n=1 Tax=Streptomyces sp. NPDC093060 TaxID=3366019 RepID=UPI003810D498
MTAYAYRSGLDLLRRRSNARTETARAVAGEWRISMTRAQGVHVVDFGTGDGDLLAAVLTKAGTPREAVIEIVERDRQLAEAARSVLMSAGYTTALANDSRDEPDGFLRESSYGTVTHLLAANVVHYLPDRLAWVASLRPLLTPNAVLTVVMRSAMCETRLLADIVRKTEGRSRAPSDQAISEILTAQRFTISRRTVPSLFTIPVEGDWSFSAAMTDPEDELAMFVRWMLSVPAGSPVPAAALTHIEDFLAARIVDGRLTLCMESIVLTARMGD